MSLKNIQLKNAEEVSNLFRTKFGKSSHFQILNGNEQFTLVSATSFSNEIFKGKQLEIKIGSSFIIDLEQYTTDIVLDLRDIDGWAVLFINENAVYSSLHDSNLNYNELKSICKYSKLEIIDLSYSDTIVDVDFLNIFSNLKFLELSFCNNLINIDGLSTLSNLIFLNLNNCDSLICLDSISNLKKLNTLELRRYLELDDIYFLKDLSNLISLNLAGCQSLIEINSLSNLTNLKFLDLGSCISLTDIIGLSNLTNLTTLNLSWCQSLTNIDCLASSLNLNLLNLENCNSLININGLSNIDNLYSLNLSGCGSLENIDGIKSSTKLTTLYLNNCISLSNLDSLSKLVNLKILKLNDNIIKNFNVVKNLNKLKSLNISNSFYLKSLDFLCDLVDLSVIELNNCSKIIFIKKLKCLQNITKLDLKDCGNIRDFEELIHCPNLKEVTWIHEATCSYVLTGSAVRRGDSLFIEEKIKGWVNDIQFSKNPIAFANELITAFGLIENQSLAKEQFIHLAKVMRERGLADGDTGNALTAHIWELWVEGLMNNESFFQEILSETLVGINYERELDVVVSPIISALADILVRYPSTKEWALLFVKEQLKTLVENEDWARTIAPAAAVFYAGMNLSEDVLFWLNKGTHPHTPKWKDTILLALVNYFAVKSKISEARKYLQQISLPDVQDQARVALVQAMSASLPTEALEDFSKINDVILQTSLAKQLALEPSILQSSEGVYQLLLCLEQTPELFSEFVASVLEKQPSTQFVQSIEALFAKPSETISLTLEFITLCDNPEVIDFVGQRRIEKLKEELKGSEMEERTILLSSFMSLLVAKNLLNIEESNELQQTLTSNL